MKFYSDLEYFFFVAIPPRICRSDKFLSKTRLTSLNSPASISFNLSVTSLCTVVQVWNGVGYCNRAVYAKLLQ